MLLPWITATIQKPNLRFLTSSLSPNFASSITMAASFCYFRPSPFLYSAPPPNPGKPNQGRRNPPLPASSNSWWTPLFGWSSDPDYISNIASDGSDAPESETAKESRSRFSLGCFTEEKAKQLRMKTLESANFHDIMYHSAIASRLASEISSDR